jgi:hypothetical protein
MYILVFIAGALVGSTISILLLASKGSCNCVRKCCE